MGNKGHWVDLLTSGAQRIEHADRHTIAVTLRMHFVNKGMSFPSLAAAPRPSHRHFLDSLFSHR